MEPSSLVFVAIIGVWVAYLVPSWARRRVALAQARARDRFSPSARVLDRRQRRAGSSTGQSAEGLHRRPVAPRLAPAALRRAAPDVGAADVARARAAERAAGSALNAAMEQAGDAAARRVRIVAVLLLASASSGGAVAAGWLPLRGAAPAAGVLVLQVLAGGVAAARGRRSVDAAMARVDAARDRRLGLERAAAAATSAAPRVPVPAASSLEASEGTWMPVPVPPPTYTLKPVVPRPEPAPLDLPEDRPAAAAAAPAAPWHPAARPVDDDDAHFPYDDRKVVNG